MSGPAEASVGPSGGSSFDEFLGGAFASASERAFAKLAGMPCGERERRVASAVLSAAAVSGHWLLASDEDVPGGLTSGVSTALRAHFQRGEPLDRDLVEWVIGVCAAVLVGLDLEPADRRVSLAIVSNALDLDGLLDPIGAKPDVGAERVTLLGRAAAALGDGTLPECEFSPLALQLVAERFEEFLASV